MPTSLFRSLGAFAMMTLLSSTLGAKPASDAFPRLSDNTAGSATLEVRKVLHGHVDGMFVVPLTRQVVVAAGRYLWKFSDQGVLQDTLRTDGTLFMSGVMFEPEHFVDWVFTGSAQRKAYGPTVDGNVLSHAEVLAVLQRAKVVEYGKTDTTAWAYVWANGQAYKMDLTQHREKVDTNCHRGTHASRSVLWPTTCFEGLRSAPRAWTEVEPDSFAGFGDAQPRVEVADFDRRKYHLEEGLGGQLLGATAGVVLKAMGVRGSLPGRYWFGDAHTRLRVGGEVVQFKTFVPYEDGEYRFMYNMRWWEPSAELPGASPWFSVHMRTYMERSGEKDLLKHYEKDIGLYVVRPRGAADVPAAQRTVPAWRPVFEGPITRYTAVTGTVAFAAPQPQGAAGQAPVAPLPPTHVWLRSPPPSPHVDGMQPPVPVDALWPALHQLPATLTVAWGSPSQEDDYTVVRIALEGRETQEVLERLLGAWRAEPMKLADANRARESRRGRLEAGNKAAAPEPLELVVRVPDLKAPLDQGEVLLRSGKRQLRLLQARLTYVVQPIERAATQASSTTTAESSAPSTAPQQKQLQAAVAAATQKTRTGLPAFLQHAKTFAQDPMHSYALAPHIAAGYAELINHFNRAGDFASSATLMRHYLADVHAHTRGGQRDHSLAYNQGVLASQTLAFAIHAPQHRDLVDGVMTTLIGPGLDPEVQTNGTLLYNLACYYAVSADKPRLLQSAKAARRLGKPPSQFMADTDFERYWKDPEFLQALQ